MKIDYPTFLKKWTRPPANQFPVGSRVYKGFQGSGKTLSMVKYAFDISKRFPLCHIFSNIKIVGLPNYHYIESDNDVKTALEFPNGGGGVLVLLDEAHLYFNKKSGIPLDVLTSISQQRKDRRRIVFSSQIWEELDISLRKQVKEIVSCRCLFGKIQFNQIFDGETLTWDKMNSSYVAKKIRSEIFKHYDSLYSSYSTFQKITTNSSYSRAYVPSPNFANVVLSLRKSK